MVTPACCVHMMRLFSQELIQSPQVNENTRFQQDGTTQCMDINLMNAINKLLPNCMHSGDTSCTARQPDLSAWYFFLGGGC
jgi:hypothetical protein